MLYQLPNGKVVYLSIEEYLNLSDEDIQYLMSIDYGEYMPDPFADSAINKKSKEEYYDFEYYPQDDEAINNIAADDIPFDDIIDLSDNLDI